MKILLANKFYYPRGGDCVYTLGLEQLLKREGHEVAIFAMEFPKNLPTPWSKYFPSEVSFSPRQPAKFLKAIIRPFFSFEVCRKLNKLLDDFKPDVVHLNNIHTQLSPLIAKIAHDRGIKVIWTLHDYKFLCPRYDCLRDGVPCELCFSGDKANVVKYRCVKGSLLASMLGWLEAKLWSLGRIQLYVDGYVCPSRFIKEKMIAGGFPDSKLHVVNNFIDSGKISGERTSKLDHYCYVGRLSEEKGVGKLLDVASQLPYSLIIAGTGPLESELKRAYKDFPHIKFLGHQAWDQIKTVVGSSRFMVVPSEWYENSPLSIIEALCLDTPVVGADIGGIPELVVEGKTGHLFTPGNREELKGAIEKAWMAKLSLELGRQDRFSDINYYNKLIEIYFGENGGQLEAS